MQNTYLNQSLKTLRKLINLPLELIGKVGSKQALYVISRTNMPSILVECGFLTNPKEEEFLHSDLGQDYIASAIFRAFRTYKRILRLKKKIKK